MERSTAKTLAAIRHPSEVGAPAKTVSRTAAEMPQGHAESSRFTVDGSDRLERLLAQNCHEVGRAIQGLIPPSRLEAVLLGGGYGRGEGGVWQTETGERPYNDLEFYVFVRGRTWLNERRWEPALHALAEQFSARAGVHVEMKILSLAKLRRSPGSMFYYDLMAGHRWVLGEESLLSGCEHHRRSEDIPMAEATRLLVNRFSGILFVQEKIGAESFTRENHDFIVRNLAKAKLALGDAILTAYRRYGWSCRERHQRLQQFTPPELIPHLDAVKLFHARGVEFKLHPRETDESWAELRDQCAEVAAVGRDLWLWLESRRLGRSFESVRSYVFGGINKCPETNGWRNRLVNAKLFGPALLFDPRAGRHPRERLLNSLPILLWEPAAKEAPEIRQLLQRELRTKMSSLLGFVSAYGSLWRRFN